MPQVYSGRDTGKFIESFLLNARRRIWVCSPYISPEYARILVNKACQGIDVRVITSNSSVNSGALSILYGEVRVKRSISLYRLSLFLLLILSGPISTILIYKLGGNDILYAIAGIWIIGMFLLPFFIGGRYLFFICLVIGFIVALITRSFFYGFIAYMIPAIIVAAYRFIITYRYEMRENPVSLLIVDNDRFVHSKIYVFDDVGIIGSANLTKSGLWRNLETITIYSGNEVGFVINEFTKIWNNLINTDTIYEKHTPLNWMY